MEAAPSCAQQSNTGKNVDSGKAKRIGKQSEQTTDFCQTLTYKHKKQKNQNICHITCGSMELTGLFTNGCIKLQPKSADVMTQCYQQFFTQTSSIYVLHHNERKKAFRKLILKSSTFFPCTQNKDLVLFSCCSCTLKEAHM